MANRRAALVDRRCGPREPSLLRVFGHLHRPRRRRRDGRRPEHRRRARSTAVAASRPSGPRLGAAAGPDTCPTPVRAGHDVQDGALWVLQGRTGLSPLGRPVRPSARRPCSSPRHAGHGGARPRTREGTCPPAIPAAAAGRRTTCSALPSLTAGQWTWWFLARARRGGGRVGHAGALSRRRRARPCALPRATDRHRRLSPRTLTPEAPPTCRAAWWRGARSDQRRWKGA